MTSSVSVLSWECSPLALKTNRLFLQVIIPLVGQYTESQMSVVYTLGVRATTNTVFNKQMHFGTACLKLKATATSPMFCKGQETAVACLQLFCVMVIVQNIVDREQKKRKKNKTNKFLPGLLNFYFSLFSFCHILFDCWHSLAKSGEASVIDRLWIRATLACRLLGEPAVQAPALPFLNWSPQNLGAHKLHNLIGRLY